MAELKQWCEERIVPDSSDEAFVLGYEAKVDPDDPDESTIRLLSTKRLLLLGTKNDLFAADATYKLN